MLEAFSKLLRDLYRAAGTTPLDSFHQAILARIRDTLPFDSAIWASGTLHDGRPDVHSFHVVDQPPEMMAAYDQIKRNDLVYGKSVDALGTTVNVDTFGAHWQARLHPDITAHCRRFNMAHILSTVDVDTVAGLFFAVSLYRGDPARPFSEQERCTNQLLIPHLAELVAISHVRHVDHWRLNGAQLRRVYAICTHRGYLLQAERGFAELLRLEWTTWHGPELPTDLREKVTDVARGDWLEGDHVAVHWEPQGPLRLLIVRPKTRFDGLTRREADIAQRFAGGAEYVDIASALGIAPATVRNHLRNTYSKLDVHSKAELINTLRKWDA